MGHVGDYFSSQHEGSGIPYGAMSVSHTWTEGFRDWYVLSGDPTAAENAVLVADHYDGAYLNNRVLRSDDSIEPVETVEQYRHGYGLGLAIVEPGRHLRLSLSWNPESAFDQPRLSIEFSADI